MLLLFYRDVVMTGPILNPAIRQGKFLWRDDASKTAYLQNLKKKIADGFYTSEDVIGRIVEDIAPIYNDNVIELGNSEY